MIDDATLYFIFK